MSNKATPQTANETATDLPKGKLGMIIRRLQQPGGASLNELIDATGWQAHSVRGVISGALKKERGLLITSTKEKGERRYMLAGPVQ